VENNGKFLFDTDILIDHLKNVDTATAFIQKVLSAKNKPFISVISRIELLSGTKLDDREEEIIKNLLKLFNVILLDEFLADLSATFRRKYLCGIADSIIAASAYKEGAVLVSRNAKHFKNIHEIKLITPY